MLERFYPVEWLDNARRIPWEKLRKQGVRGVIFDIDNTLVPHDAPADAQAQALFSQLRALGIRTCLLSNNRRPRVQKFAEAVGADAYLWKAGKPGRGGYLRAMELLGTGQASTLFVGDQLFTDIWGANRAGIKSILVNPINPREEIQIVLKRIPEKLVLHFYKKRRHA